MTPPDDLEIILEDLRNNVDLFSAEEIAELQSSVRQIEQMEMIEKARTDFAAFVRLCGPPYLRFSSKGQHHRMCSTYERMIDGDLKRVTVSLPPRFGKSEFGSICLPAWAIGKNPTWKIIQASAKDEIATDFGRKVKGIIDSPMFQRVFPGVRLSKDSKASGKFATNQGGTYFAIGVGSGVAGLGGDLIICDDIVNEQDAKTGKPEAFEAAWTWFQTGPLQRLQPGGRVVMIGTRWSKADPIGKVKRRMAEDPRADRYESIEFKALDESDQSNFPEIWPTAELVAKKHNMFAHFWAAQYDQNPTASTSSIIPAASWRKWDKFRSIPGSTDEVEFVPPECSFILMVLDTAYTANKRSNPTACTVWGVFEHRDTISGRADNHLILLHAYKRKMEFGELKRVCKAWIKEWKPDCTLIEAKSSGPMVRSELAEAGVYTTPVAPKPGEDKVVRLNAVSDVFASGKVWYIPTNDCQQVIAEVADFPAGDEDDFTDTVAYGVMRFRKGGFVSTNNDVAIVEQEHIMPPGGYY